MVSLRTMPKVLSKVREESSRRNNILSVHLDLNCRVSQ
jgi:hypothetical protein